jgi:antitoxin (DNA-binding transcriptional repressor) of toxin-antitoxin stability system
MKTLSVTEGRQNLGAWLKRALRGQDIGFVVDGQVVALRPVTVHSEDYVLREYGVDQKQVRRAWRTVQTQVRSARQAGRSKPFAGRL